MPSFNKVFNQVLALLYGLYKVDLIKIWKHHSKDADHIVWICPIWPRRGIEYFFRTTFIADLSIINVLIKRGIKFRILLGSKKIGRLHNKTIHYSVSYHFDFHNLNNHSAPIRYIVSELEKQNNRLILPSKDIDYWENKDFMHIRFNELNINCPKTIIRSINDSIDDIEREMKFPFLWKDLHSAGSLGVYKINNYKELKSLHSKKKNKAVSAYLIQELINMRSDLRVTLVGNVIVHHYWRFNNSEEWKPTSTTHGSKADFENFPEKWRNQIIADFRKTGLVTGAFDITFDNDNTDTPPIYLEVSPSYDLNPPQPKALENLSYKEYKKKYFIKESYFKGRVNLIFELKDKVYQALGL